MESVLKVPPEFSLPIIELNFSAEENSITEERYDIIRDVSAGSVSMKPNGTIIGNLEQSIGKIHDILFVVYTERIRIEKDGSKTDITRLISARRATNFERGLYYGKYEYLNEKLNSAFQKCFIYAELNSIFSLTFFLHCFIISP